MTDEQFIDLVTATQKVFRRFLVALCCGDSMLADDIAQESYIKAYLCYSSLGDVDKFNSWLFKIGYNTYLNHKRKVRITVGYEEIKGKTARESADSSFRYQELYEALNRLTINERTAILLFYMQGYTVKEISQIQNVSGDSVKQYLARGRKHLREILDK